jgi:hypothetical protein
MKFFTNKKIVQKIVIAILIVILTSFCIPSASQADTGGKLMSPIIQLVVSLMDGVQHLLELSMLGEYSSFMQDVAREYEVDGAPTETSETGPIYQVDEFIDANFFGLNAINIPRITYTPEEIFSNRVPALDVNFINPSITTGDSETDEKMNVAVKLRPTIASWYVAMRYIAIVGLLSVLVYIGIRMLLTSVAADRAKYKQMLFDWIVAICLVFILHYIMSFTMTMSETITSMISPNANGTFTVYATNMDGAGFSKYQIAFTTNLMSYVRFMVQAGDLSTKVAFLCLYIMLVIFSIRFTWIYLKRVLNMAFLTLIAPLVALTYPIDKVGDGKAQAFNMWLKEYIYNALIQPLDLLLYTVLLGSAIDLAIDNPIYAIVALGFIIAAEKLVKQMFGFNKASGGTVGSLAAAAGVTTLANSALNAFAKKGPGGAPQKGKIRTADIPERQGKDNGSNSPFAAFKGRNANAVLGAGNDYGSKTLSPEQAKKLESKNQKQSSDLSGLTDEEKREYEKLQNQGLTTGWSEDDISRMNELNAKQQAYIDTGSEIPSPEEYYSNSSASLDTANNPSFFDTVRTDVSNWKDRRANDITSLKDKFTMADEARATGKSSKELRQQKLKNAINKRAIAAWKAAPTVAYSAARGTLKTTSRVAAAAAMGTLGLAIGATTGDGEKAVSMALGAAGVGFSTGDNLFEASHIGKAMQPKSISEAYGAGLHGNKQDARNAKADKEYFKSEKFDDFYDKYYKGKKDVDGNQYTKQRLKDITQSYRTAGITSEKDIRKALKLEEQYRKANSSLSEKDARAEVQNIVQAYNDMDAQDRRAFTNKEARENVINNISGLVNGRTPDESRKMAEKIFQGYVDFRNA